MSDEVRITGGCLCGAIRFEASSVPYHATYCHCRMCQRTSGSILSTWADFKPSEFNCTHGEIKFYQSSEFLERGFCNICGSTLIQRSLDSGDVFIATGCLDQPEAVPMREHCGIEGQVPWLKIVDDLPRKTTNEAMGYEVTGNE